MEPFPKLKRVIDSINTDSITEERKEVLTPLINYIQAKKNEGQTVRLNFICTHNSRRSQLSQIWGQTAGDFYGIDTKTSSGGVEVTAFNERAVASIERFGFEIIKTGEGNPTYKILHSPESDPIIAFSKVYDDAQNPSSNFSAVMTCDHADENCPHIIGADERIPVRYNDPKAFDDTPQESEKYDERSLQIATELFYVFSEIK